MHLSSAPTSRRMLADAPAIHGNDVLRLVHVQLRLSSFGVAEVEGETWPSQFFVSFNSVQVIHHSFHSIGYWFPSHVSLCA